MRASPSKTATLITVVSVLLAAAPVMSGAALDTETEDALLKIEAILAMPEFSQMLWPSWDISDTPFGLSCQDGHCYLINHPAPPPTFERLREDTDVSTAVYRGTPTDEGKVMCIVRGVPTAILQLRGFSDDAVARAFEAAFRVHQQRMCEGGMDRIDLLSGYPVDVGNLVMADIECLLLRRAALAPDDSLDQYVREFAVVRWNRRLSMGGRYAEYERRIEFSQGISAYLAERCRSDASSYLSGMPAERLESAVGLSGTLERRLAGEHDLNWYRDERFVWTGAMICALMDRFDPEWKDETSRDCVDPFEVMWRRVRGETPVASTILERFDYEGRVAGRSLEIEESKTAAERLFESIARSKSQVFSISTNLPTGGEVSFDRSGIEKVDDHRQVQTRLIHIEYSSGTFVKLENMLVGIVLGDDEFDFRKLMFEAPEEYTITIDGRELAPEEGAYEFTRLLTVEAEGVSIRALAGTVMIGVTGMSFVLQR